MSAAFTFAGIPGVRACLVGGSDGRVLEETVAHPDNSKLIAAAATLVTASGTLGALLGLGSVEVVSEKGTTGSWVIGSHTDWTIAVQVDVNRSTAPVEAALRNTDWFSMVDWDVSTSEIECVSVDEADPEPARPVEPGTQEGGPQDPGSPRDERSGLKWRAAPKYRQVMMRPSPSANEFRAKEEPTSPGVVDFALRDVRTNPPSGLANSAIFAGDLKMFGVADLIEFLANARRTGVLTCNSKGKSGTLHMRSGKVVAAACPAIHGLREYLAPRSSSAADGARALPEASSALWVGPGAAVILVQLGVRTTSEVREALKEQLGATVAELLTWADGDFSFESERASEASLLELELEFEPNSLLLEILKTQDERAAAVARGG